MTAVRSEAALDAVERRKLHVYMADLRKEAQSLRKLVELTRPAQMPSLLPRSDSMFLPEIKVCTILFPEKVLNQKKVFFSKKEKNKKY